jgi:hypothetical protein
MSPDVDVASLSVGEEIGEGGQGQVYALTGEPSLVLKTYRQQFTSSFYPDALTHLIGMDDVVTCNGRPVHDWAAWPHARVTDKGRVIGFLMRRVPASYARLIGGRLRLADLSYLATTPPPIWGKVELPHTDERLRILAHLAGVIDALHRHGLVIGDLSFGNVLWSLDPVGVMLIDCDGIHPEHGRSAMPQADTIDWGDPQGGGNPPDRDRDCYKLSLAVVRVLSRTLSAVPAQAGALELDLPEERQEAVRELLRQAAGPRGTRPNAGQWRMVLGSRQMRAVSTPVVRTTTGPQPKPDLLVGPNTPRHYRPVTPPKPPA